MAAGLPGCQPGTLPASRFRRFAPEIVLDERELAEVRRVLAQVLTV